MKALLGTKRGMTQIWREDGSRLPVTVIDLEPNTVTALKTEDRDGYDAIQLGFGAIRAKCVAKPQLGQFAKAGVEPRRHLREVRGMEGEYAVGDQVPVTAFEVGSKVDVVGTSKGKGFAGTIKRHGFSRGPVTHGSQNVRRPGSIGMCKYPGRVIKGKRMAGHMGNERVTVKNLEVVAVDEAAHQLLVRGPVPGHDGALLLVRTSWTGKKKS